MLNTVVLVLYAGLFAYHCWISGQKQWLLASALLGMVSSWWLSGVLSGFVYQHGSLLLYLTPMWVSLGSLFFFVNTWRYHRATQVFYAEPPCSPYLVYLAVSGMMLHLAWLVPLLWAQHQYPEGMSYYVLQGLLQMYFLQPLYWVLLQWCLMLLFFVAQRWRKTPVVVVSMGQLQFAFLFGLCAVSAYVISDLSKYLR